MLKKIGDRLTIIGVAHVLSKSAAEVRDTIERERPEVVAVELCPMRYAALVGGAREAGVSEALRSGQLRLFITGKLLRLIQTKFANQTGMPAGEEMLAAIKCAKEVGARVELIDQNIAITLQRLVGQMGRREKIRLIGEILLALLPFGSNGMAIERVTEDQVVTGLLSSLKQSSPTSYRVLIEERDEYMAARILITLTSNAGKVVCVVGAGHVPGLYRRLATQAKGGWGTKLEYSVT